MKRLVCGTVVLLLIVAPQLQAQNIDLGVKGGINIATVSTDISDLEPVVKSKVGFVGGIFASFRLGTILAIQPELLYSQKGFKAEEAGVSLNLNTDYFEIPLLIKGNINAGETVRPALYAGPVVSFEVSCDISAMGVSVDCDQGGFTRKMTDFGVNFGGSLDIFVSSIILLIDVRYQLGLVNLNDDESEPNDSVKSRTFQIMAGVAFTP